jgi:hypothetical protein
MKDIVLGVAAVIGIALIAAQWNLVASAAANAPDSVSQLRETAIDLSAAKKKARKAKTRETTPVRVNPPASIDTNPRTGGDGGGGM